MANVIVLGTGMVGSAIALDLAQSHKVTAVDMDPEAFSGLDHANIHSVVLDVSDRNGLNAHVQNHDLAINAMPGFLGFNILNNLIELGMNVVDISFFPEDPLPLNAKAKQQSVIAVVDMGVAPGLGNVILGHYDQTLDIDTFKCLVGGLPKQRNWPFQYKAPFSPIDVIEEYTRPARLMINGEISTRPALSDSELVEFDGIGSLEAFNTDGLRSLLYTMPHIPNMVEKTLRYPGHIELIKTLQSAGFFSPDPVGQTRLSALDFTAEILKKQWQLQPGEKEFTVLRIDIAGSSKTPKPKQIQVAVSLHDEYDTKTGTTSMARTTGYTCTATAELILQQQITHPGVYAPEHIGAQNPYYEFILNYLKQRGVQLNFQAVHPE